MCFMCQPGGFNLTGIAKKPGAGGKPAPPAARNPVTGAGLCAPGPTPAPAPAQPPIAQPAWMRFRQLQTQQQKAAAGPAAAGGAVGGAAAPKPKPAPECKQQ